MAQLGMIIQYLLALCDGYCLVCTRFLIPNIAILYYHHLYYTHINHVSEYNYIIFFTELS